MRPTIRPRGTSAAKTHPMMQSSPMLSSKRKRARRRRRQRDAALHPWRHRWRDAACRRWQCRRQDAVRLRQPQLRSGPRLPSAAPPPSSSRWQRRSFPRSLRRPRFASHRRRSAPRPPCLAPPPSSSPGPHRSSPPRRPARPHRLRLRLRLPYTPQHQFQPLLRHPLRRRPQTRRRQALRRWVIATRSSRSSAAAAWAWCIKRATKS